MKIGRGSRRSVRYSIFIGVLAGSVFSGSGAFGIELASISGRVELNEDIELDANSIYEAGSPLGSTYFGVYSGTFSGNGATITGLTVPLFNSIEGSISNLTLTSINSGATGQGLLANSIETSGTVDSVIVSGTLIPTANYSGGLVGGNFGAILNSQSDVNIDALNSGHSSIGGLAGDSSGTITNSSATGSVVGTNTVGGLVGTLSGGDISGSTFTGTVQGERYVGGLVGLTGSSTISNSSASGIVTGLESYEGNIGGLVGGGSGTISNSTASVAVTGYEGTSNIGGLIGNADVNVQIIDSSSSGTVTGTSNVGGLAGQIAGSLILNSSSSAVVSGESVVGGLVGYAIVGGPYYGPARGISSPENGEPGYLNAEIQDSFSTGAVNGGTNIGGLVGYLEGDVSGSYSLSPVNQLRTGASSGNRLGGLIGVMGSGSVSDSYATGGGYSIGGYDFIGGLIGRSLGNITESNASISGNVFGAGNVGGLVGYTAGSVSNSYSYVSAGVAGNYYVGGLAGYVAEDITNSYSLIDGNVEGNGSVGGLVGSMDGVISNSYSRILGSVIGENDYVGGLVGFEDSTISNSYAMVTGDVTGAHDRVGGLAGLSYGDISNSHAIVGGIVSGRLDVGGLVGFINVEDFENGMDISNSYFQGNVSGSFDYYGYFVGGFVGGGCSGCTISNSYSEGTVFVASPDDGLNIFAENPYVFAGNSYVNNGISNSCAGEIINGQLSCLDGRTVPRSSLSEIGAQTGVGALGEEFATDACLNDGNPYLVALIDSYESSCGGGTPPPTTPTRERIEREIREVVETRTPEKIEKLDGFKKEATVAKDAAIAFDEPTEKIEVAKVKAVEIAATANVRVNAKADEALQISLKSESKEPVELWVKSPDGKWLLAGVITFDKDGKAILPPLKFKNVGNYSLVLSKPTADSAKGSAPLNQTGSVLVAVS